MNTKKFKGTFNSSMTMSQNTKNTKKDMALPSR